MSTQVKKLWLLVLASVVCGALLAAVRTGILGIAPFPLFYILFVVFLGVFFAAGYFLRFKTIRLFEENEGGKHLSDRFPPANRLLCVIASFLVLLGAVLSLLRDRSAVGIISAVFAIICGVTMLLRVSDSEKTERTAVFSLFPVYYICFYLLIFYRIHSKTAELSLYGPEALTVVCLVFAAYYNSAVKFIAPKNNLRVASALISLALSFFELFCLLFGKETLVSIPLASYLPLVFGFSIYFAAALFRPQFMLYDITDKQ